MMSPSLLVGRLRNDGVQPPQVADSFATLPRSHCTRCAPEAVGPGRDSDAGDLDFGGARVAIQRCRDVDANAIGGEGGEVQRLS